MQTLMVIVVVAAAAIYVARKVLVAFAKARRTKNEAGCGSDGCCKP